jgi:P pilus assembly chaperone PapD
MIKVTYTPESITKKPKDNENKLKFKLRIQENVRKL